jgi:hypothetical protein
MRVMIVQSRPYQAFAGGDGAYVNALVRHLEGAGCKVRGITSGSTKGRPRPWLRLAYAGPRDEPWRFRATWRIGRRYLALGPQLLRDAIAFIAEKRRASRGMDEFARRPAAAEYRWISQQVASFAPQLTILCFEAAALAREIRTLGSCTLALVGFLPNRGYSLSDVTPDGDGAVAPDSFLEAVRGADAIAFSSLDDRNFARDTLGLPNSIFLGMGFAGQSQQTQGNAPIVLFVGNKTGANRGAVEWFCTRVWPSVRDAVPGARFRIVGRVAQYFGDDQTAGIECIGAVDDLAEEYCQARLVVAPLLAGSAGVKTKVAEAISYGCPIVTTSLGADAADRNQIDLAGYVCDDPAVFAQRVSLLLSNDDEWRAKQSGTRAVFDRVYSRQAAYGELAPLLARARNGADHG